MFEMAGQQASAGKPLTRLAVTGIIVVLLAASCTSGSPHSSEGTPSPAKSRASSIPSIADLVIPQTYQQACADEAGFCMGSPAGKIPGVLLNRPLRLPTLRQGERCPATHGHVINNPKVIYGVALGQGPVQVVIEGAGDLSRGIAGLLESFTPAWRGTKTLWLSLPAYQGPIVIRAKRLDGNGPISINSASDGPSLAAAPLILPPGPTVNGTQGWREAPAGTWVRSPGCYGWQVDGLTFTEIITVQFVCAPQYSCPKDFGRSRKD